MLNATLMTKHFNGLTEAEAERLAVLMEKMAETQKVIGKILRHGYESRDPTRSDSPTNRELLALELGDVVVAMSLVTCCDDVAEAAIKQRALVKTESILKYLHHQETGEEQLNLFQLGAITLHSGNTSIFKIDCDALPDSDLECLAYLLAQRLPPYGLVEGVPRGGLRLAVKMLPYSTGGPLLIVDDVWTTGMSMVAHRRNRHAIGAVLFARSEVANWVTALFTMNP